MNTSRFPIHTPQLLRTSIVALAFAFAGHAAWAGPNQTETAASEASPEEQLSLIQTRINLAQQEAIKKESVQEKQFAYIDSLREAIKETDPKAGDLLKKQDELVATLNSSPEINRPLEQRSAEFQQTFGEYQMVSRELQPMVQQASSQQEVQDKHEEMQKSLLDEMTRIDKDIPRFLEERENLLAANPNLGARMPQR